MRTGRGGGGQKERGLKNGLKKRGAERKRGRKKRGLRKTGSEENGGRRKGIDSPRPHSQCTRRKRSYSGRAAAEKMAAETVAAVTAQPWRARGGGRRKCRVGVTAYIPAFLEIDAVVLLSL